MASSCQNSKDGGIPVKIPLLPLELLKPSSSVAGAAFVQIRWIARSGTIVQKGEKMAILKYYSPGDGDTANNGKSSGDTGFENSDKSDKASIDYASTVSAASKISTPSNTSNNSAPKNNQRSLIRARMKKRWVNNNATSPSQISENVANGSSGENNSANGVTFCENTGSNIGGISIELRASANGFLQNLCSESTIPLAVNIGVDGEGKTTTTPLTNTILAQIQPCEHPAVVGELCAVCGADVRKTGNAGDDSGDCAVGPKGVKVEDSFEIVNDTVGNENDANDTAQASKGRDDNDTHSVIDLCDTDDENEVSVKMTAIRSKNKVKEEEIHSTAGGGPSAASTTKTSTKATAASTATTDASKSSGAPSPPFAPKAQTAAAPASKLRSLSSLLSGVESTRQMQQHPGQKRPPPKSQQQQLQRPVQRPMQNPIQRPTQQRPSLQNPNSHSNTNSKMTQMTVSGGITLTISESEAKSISDASSKKLKSDKQLCLVLDLDHTLLHATDDVRAGRFVAKEVWEEVDNDRQEAGQGGVATNCTDKKSNASLNGAYAEGKGESCESHSDERDLAISSEKSNINQPSSQPCLTKMQPTQLMQQQQPSDPQSTDDPESHQNSQQPPHKSTKKIVTNTQKRSDVRSILLPVDLPLVQYQQYLHQREVQQQASPYILPPLPHYSQYSNANNDPTSIGANQSVILRHFVKIRPHLKHFFETLSPLYKLSVYTAGTRAYAEQIAITICRHLVGSNRANGADEDNGGKRADVSTEAYGVALDEEELVTLRNKLKQKEEECKRYKEKMEHKTRLEEQLKSKDFREKRIREIRARLGRKRQLEKAADEFHRESVESVMKALEQESNNQGNRKMPKKGANEHRKGKRGVTFSSQLDNGVLKHPEQPEQPDQIEQKNSSQQIEQSKQSGLMKKGGAILKNGMGIGSKVGKSQVKINIKDSEKDCKKENKGKSKATAIEIDSDPSPNAMSNGDDNSKESSKENETSLHTASGDDKGHAIATDAPISDQVSNEEADDNDENAKYWEDERKSLPDGTALSLSESNPSCNSSSLPRPSKSSQSSPSMDSSQSSNTLSDQNIDDTTETTESPTTTSSSSGHGQGRIPRKRKRANVPGSLLQQVTRPPVKETTTKEALTTTESAMKEKEISYEEIEKQAQLEIETHFQQLKDELDSLKKLQDPSHGLEALRIQLEQAEKLEIDAMDLRRKLFGSRIVSRTDVGDLGKDVKSLKRVFPCGGVMAAIVDDREDVWANAENNVTGRPGEPPDNLLLVKPYHFSPFSGYADVNNASGNDLSKMEDGKKRGCGDGDKDKSKTSAGMEEENDQQLLWTANILKRLHARYYSENVSEEERDAMSVPDLLRQMKRETLGSFGAAPRANVVFSGLIPIHKQNVQSPVRHPVVRYAEELGALVLPTISKQATHIVAARDGSEKIRRARVELPKCFIVHTSWLMECYWSLTRRDVRPHHIGPMSKRQLECNANNCNAAANAARAAIVGAAATATSGGQSGGTITSPASKLCDKVEKEFKLLLDDSEEEESEEDDGGDEDDDFAADLESEMMKEKK